MTKRYTVKTVQGLNRALRALPKEASNELKDANQEAVGLLADHARSEAMGVSRTYARWVAPTIKARRDRLPVVKMGGRRMIPGRSRRPNPANQRVGNLLFGVEYGGRRSKRTMQFLPHLGTTGYALWPTIRRDLPDIIDSWHDATVDAVGNSVRRHRG